MLRLALCSAFTVTALLALAGSGSGMAQPEVQAATPRLAKYQPRTVAPSVQTHEAHNARLGMVLASSNPTTTCIRCR